MSNIEIIQNLILPTPKRAGAKSAYPIAELEVGAGFLIPIGDRKEQSVKQTLWKAAKIYSKAHPGTNFQIAPALNAAGVACIGVVRLADTVASEPVALKAVG